MFPAVPLVPPFAPLFAPRFVRFALHVAGFLVAACLLCLPAPGLATLRPPQAATSTPPHKAHRRARTHRANPVPAERVTYTGGQLSVQSSGADLAEVLGAIQQAIGVKITGVAAAQNQKLVGEFGPGDPAGVLAELLDGKRLNYIILKSQSDPKIIRSVMLFTESAPQTQPLTPPAPRTVPAPPQSLPENRPAQPAGGRSPTRDRASSSGAATRREPAGARQHPALSKRPAPRLTLIGTQTAVPQCWSCAGLDRVAICSSSTHPRRTGIQRSHHRAS